MTDAEFSHTEVIDLRVSPAQMREFIMTPDRILDYYPGPVGGGVLEAGRSIYCCGQGGVSLLEVLDDETTDRCVVIRVTTAFGLEAPYTRDRIEEAASFSMVEDWDLEPTDNGTRLTKTWRAIRERGALPFSLGDTLRASAANETGALVEGWERAAGVA